MKTVYSLKISIFLCFVISCQESPKAVSDNNQTLTDTKRLYPFNDENYLYGYMDSKGNVEIEPQYIDAKAFSESGLAVVSKGFRKWVYINTSNEVVIDNEFTYAKPFNEFGLASVGTDSGSAIINTKGEIVSSARSSSLLMRKFNELGLAKVVAGNQHRFIDTTGKTIIMRKGRMEFIDKKYGLIKFYKDKKYGLMDTSGETILFPLYKSITRLGMGFAKIQYEDKYGIVNKYGEIITPVQFDEIRYFDDSGLVAVRKEDKWGFIDSLGKIAIPLQFDDVSYPRFGKFDLGGVKQGDKWNYINTSGDIVLHTDFDMIFPFSEFGLASFAKNDKMGYINKSGEVVIKAEYDRALPFEKSGVAIVMNIKKELKELEDFNLDNVSMGLINSVGEVILPLKYIFSEREFGDCGLAMADKDGYGVVNMEGEIVALAEYSEFPRFANKCKFIYFKKKGKCGYMNMNGKVVVSPKFTSIKYHEEDNVCTVTYGKRTGLVNMEGDFIGFTEAEFDAEWQKVRNKIEKQRQRDLEYKRQMDSRIKTKTQN